MYLPAGTERAGAGALGAVVKQHLRVSSISLYSRAAICGWSTVIREVLQLHGRHPQALFIENAPVYKFYIQITCNAAINGNDITVASSTHSRLRHFDMTALVPVMPKITSSFQLGFDYDTVCEIAFKDQHSTAV